MNRARVAAAGMAIAAVCFLAGCTQTDREPQTLPTESASSISAPTVSPSPNPDEGFERLTERDFTIVPPECGDDLGCMLPWIKGPGFTDASGISEHVLRAAVMSEMVAGHVGDRVIYLYIPTDVAERAADVLRDAFGDHVVVVPHDGPYLT